MSELEEFRARKDEFFKTGHESPIPTEELDVFEGLKYFPENPALRFEIPLEGVPPEDFEFETSTGERKTYKKVGKLKFAVPAGRQEVEGAPAQLTLYQAESGSYFLPFRDATSGKETHGAGRYLEVRDKDGKIELDFNFAYNPYCAYNEVYSCPLPPIENWLKVPIRAGEKKFREE
ncbi:DUF1684 domain-containing protein [Candidatus Saccharibacteria bacterium]|nr:DUF1684 domain-containing protein [Candidatus Saccharibacteria bacterium]